MTGIATVKQAARFLAEAGIALRYGPHKTLPLESVYAAVARRDEPERDAQRRATELTNALIGEGTAIEINCIVDRVALAHASLVPPLIALRRRGRGVDELVSDVARRALDFIAHTARPTAGQLRAHLGVPAGRWPNLADDALTELQRALLVDRGPTDVPATGAPYLTKDGIPYRIVDEVHAAHVRAAGKLAIGDAADALISRLAGTMSRNQLAKAVKLCLSTSEVDAALERVKRRGR